MSKYGLNLRPQKKKQPPRPPLPKPLGFGDDDDNDVEKEISRHASKNKSLKDIEEQQKKALEEDPLVFDYDGVYDQMKRKAIQPRMQDQEERKPRYIQSLMKLAEQRNREQEIVYERKLAKERSQEDHLYADKDKFVTSAYKKKLAEQAKWMEEERLRQLREENDDVTKKKDLTDFYFNLGKNVAFGAEDVKARKLEERVGLSKAEKHVDRPIDVASEPLEESSRVREAESESSKPEKHQEIAISAAAASDLLESRCGELSDAKQASNTSAQEKPSIEPPSEIQPAINHHKRTEDALAAAKERYLARKRAKLQ